MDKRVLQRRRAKRGINQKLAAHRMDLLNAKHSTLVIENNDSRQSLDSPNLVSILAYVSCLTRRIEGRLDPRQITLLVLVVEVNNHLGNTERSLSK